MNKDALAAAGRAPRRNEKAKNDMQEIIVSLFAVAGYNPLDAIEVLEVALAGMRRVAAEAQQKVQGKRK